MPDIITKKDYMKHQIAIGESCEKYLASLNSFSKDELDRLREETLRIYSYLNFNNDTALVVGRIQSGKTTSFVNLSSIAHDNNVPLVIIIAGVSKTLTSQTFTETQKLSDSDHWSSILVSSTSDISGVMDPKDKNFSEEIKNNLTRFDKVPQQLKKSQLLVVMKEDDNLEHLAVALKRIPEKILNSTKVLIIDDEVDQYGLNSKYSENKQSTIYSKIEQLRDIFIKHSYVGYTATPQANMLIQLKDMMSPNYIFSITPGKNYVGGKDLFDDISSSNNNLKIINQFNLDDDNETIPEDLQKALLEFCIIATNSIFKEQDPKNPVTMLIHPDRLTDSHKIHVKWVNTYLEHMKMKSTRLEEDTSFKNNLIKAHGNFIKRRNNFISQEELLKNIEHVFGEIKVKEQNTRVTGKIEQITWKDRAYIVIAGMNADRGTQIKGLVSTYLSRSTGAGNIDTLQQRARFFGYKKSYMDLIQIYITKESAEFFHNYIEHEEHLHDKIIEANGIMPDVRQLVVMPGFNLTRPSVYDGGVKIKKTESQISSQRPFRQNLIQNNTNVIKNFISSFFSNSNKEQSQNPSVEIKGEEVLDLLFSMNYGDCGQFNKIKTVFPILFQAAKERNLNHKYEIYLMNGGKKRERKTKENGAIEQLLQGPASNYTSDTSLYPGDKSFVNKENISFQLHHNTWKGKGINAWSIIMFIPKALRDEMKELNIFITDR